MGFNDFLKRAKEVVFEERPADESTEEALNESERAYSRIIIDF